jgi:hypothetical protein
LQNLHNALGFIFKVLSSTPLFGLLLFFFVTLYPPLDILVEVNLSFHMLEHVLIVSTGIFMAYPVFRRRRCEGPMTTNHKSAILIFSNACTVLVFSDLPYFWDLAVLNSDIRIMEHISFLIFWDLARFFHAITL